MKYYFIYSAGGGAGDWNGVKRIWNDCMPIAIKSNILLKFGDVFLNHAAPTTPCRPRRWNDITNLREWLYEATADEYTLNEANILLDSGSAKLVNFIAHNNPQISNDDLIVEFDNILNRYQIIEKYIDIIATSNINGAVTFDIPNPFKIRSQNGNARLNILTQTDRQRLIELSANYSNRIYHVLNNSSERLYTIINGEWSLDEVNIFLSLLDYRPRNFAIGGVSSADESTFIECINTLAQAQLNYEHIHFLGCGGLKKVAILRNTVFDNERTSVDCSTPINRSIDGNVSGTAQSCYYSYQNQELIRIKPETRNRILQLHAAVENPLFDLNEMTNIIDTVLRHQNHQSNEETYNGRAKLLIHNTDVYKRFANN
ncbi:MAG: hypothetical protein J1G01_01240 [Clostridiales bacterium]|nr:hypothetical protein [Clostridiales bacterium]